MSTTRYFPPSPPVFSFIPTFRPGAFAQRLSRRYPRGGFTLIELLICIAIIGILAVVMIPYINGALDSAKKVKCVSNLHQIGVMTATYCVDSGNILPPGGIWSSGGSTWLEVLVAQVKGVSIPDARNAIARGEVQAHCPVVLPSDTGLKAKAPSGAFYWINYGINYVNLGGVQATPELPNFSRLNVTNPAKCIYIADGQSYLLNYAWSAAQPVGRHHGKSNVLWMDGHVTSELQSWLVDPANYNENWLSTR